jgi:putative acetyltransferase
MGQVEIREEKFEDVRGISAVHDAAFGRRNEGHLVERLREEGLIAASLVASDSGRIVANAVFSRLTVRSSGKPIAAAALAPVAVTPTRQSRGIGARLIRSGLTLCAQRGYDIVVVLGDPQYYRRFGFSSELAKNVRSRYSCAGPAWMAVELHISNRPLTPCEVTYPAAFEEAD